MQIFVPGTNKYLSSCANGRTLCALALVCTLLLSGCSTSSNVQRHTRGTPSTLSGDQASNIAIHALGLVGTPYRYGGNTPTGGFDCSGLIGYVYRNEVGTPPPRTVAQLSGWGETVDADDLRTGDLVLFGRGRRPTHAGIYVGAGRFVHAPSSGGEVRLDVLTAGYWARQSQEFRRP
ncbi:MAG: C40 family peptidase [Giesbergeria sp.]